MRAASEQALAALPGVVEIVYEADVLRGAERLAEAVPLTDLQITFDASAKVEATGSCRIVRSPLRGESWVPSGPGDMLSPFGTELAVVAHVRLGEALDERIPLGVFPIKQVPSSQTGVAVLAGASYVVAESIEVEFADRMSLVVDDRFTVPESPATAPTAYAELERLTGQTVNRTGADQAIRAGILYDKERVEAVEQIAGILGGDAFFNAAGELEVRPDVPGPVVARLDARYVAPVAPNLSADGVYNGIVVTGKGEDGSEIRVEQWLTSGPLAVEAWGRRKPKFYHSDYLFTLAMVAAEAERQLALLTQPNAQHVAADIVPFPLLELGDVVELSQPSGEVVTVRVSSIRVGAGLWAIGGDRL